MLSWKIRDQSLLWDVDDICVNHYRRTCREQKESLRRVVSVADHWRTQAERSRAEYVMRTNQKAVLVTKHYKNHEAEQARRAQHTTRRVPDDVNTATLQQLALAGFFENARQMRCLPLSRMLPHDTRSQVITGQVADRTTWDRLAATHVPFFPQPIPKWCPRGLDQIKSLVQSSMEQVLCCNQSVAAAQTAALLQAQVVSGLVMLRVSTHLEWQHRSLCYSRLATPGCEKLNLEGLRWKGVQCHMESWQMNDTLLRKTMALAASSPVFGMYPRILHDVMYPLTIAVQHSTTVGQCLDWNGQLCRIDGWASPRRVGDRSDQAVAMDCLTLGLLLQCLSLKAAIRACVVDDLNNTITVSRQEMLLQTLQTSILSKDVDSSDDEDTTKGGTISETDNLVCIRIDANELLAEILEKPMRDAMSRLTKQTLDELNQKNPIELEFQSLDETTVRVCLPNHNIHRDVCQERVVYAVTEVGTELVQRNLAALGGRSASRGRVHELYHDLVVAPEEPGKNDIQKLMDITLTLGCGNARTIAEQDEGGGVSGFHVMCVVQESAGGLDQRSNLRTKFNTTLVDVHRRGARAAAQLVSGIATGSMDGNDRKTVLKFRGVLSRELCANAQASFAIKTPLALACIRSMDDEARSLTGGSADTYTAVQFDSKEEMERFRDLKWMEAAPSAELRFQMKLCELAEQRLDRYVPTCEHASTVCRSVNTLVHSTHFVPGHEVEGVKVRVRPSEDDEAVIRSPYFRPLPLSSTTIEDRRTENERFRDLGDANWSTICKHVLDGTGRCAIFAGAMGVCGKRPRQRHVMQSVMVATYLRSLMELPAFADDPGIWHPLLHGDTVAMAAAMSAWSGFLDTGEACVARLADENVASLNGLSEHGSTNLVAREMDARMSHLRFSDWLQAKNTQAMAFASPLKCPVDALDNLVRKGDELVGLLVIRKRKDEHGTTCTLLVVPRRRAKDGTLLDVRASAARPTSLCGAIATQGPLMSAMLQAIVVRSVSVLHRAGIQNLQSKQRLMGMGRDALEAAFGALPRDQDPELSLPCSGAGASIPSYASVRGAGGESGGRRRRRGRGGKRKQTEK